MGVAAVEGAATAGGRAEPAAAAIQEELQQGADGEHVGGRRRWLPGPQAGIDEAGCGR